jgi:hypothetical protein
MAFQPMTPPNPTATLPWYERMNPFGEFVPAAEKSARAQGLLQLGLGILANNQGNYGALGPALARGGMQGLQAYQGALMQQSQKRRNQLQDKLLGAQINETTAQAAERQAKMDATKNREQQWGALLKELESIPMPEQPTQIGGPGSVGPDGQAIAPSISVVGGKPWEQDPKMLRFAASKAMAFDPDKADNLMKRAEALEKATSVVPKTLPGAPYYSYNAKGELVFNQDVFNKELELGRAKATNFNFGQPIAVDAGDGTQKLVQVNPQGKVIETGLKPGGANANKQPAEIQRQVNALSALQKTMDAYEDAMKDVDPRSFDQLDPQKKARIEAILADAIVNYKEAAALGALTGPDVSLIEKGLTNPLSAKGAIYGRGGIQVQINEVRNAIARRQQSIGGGQSFGGGNQPQGGGTLSKAARMVLQEGKVTTFRNGQRWTLRNGKEVFLGGPQ